MLAVCEKLLEAGFLFYTRRFCPSVCMGFRMYYFLAFCVFCLYMLGFGMVVITAYQPISL